MSVNQVDKQTGDTSRIAGGTLYADAPIGAILAFGGATAPAGWMICNGAAVSRTTYAALFEAIGTAFGAGDGSTTFNLPDLREATTKGAGETGQTVGNHVKSGGLAVGEFIDDRLQEHQHKTRWPSATSPTSEYIFTATPQNNTYTGSVVTDVDGGRSGDTTEVKAVGVNYIIKAQQVALPLDIENQVETVAGNSAEAYIEQKLKGVLEYTLTVGGEWRNYTTNHMVIRFVDEASNVDLRISFADIVQGSSQTYNTIGQTSEGRQINIYRGAIGSNIVYVSIAGTSTDHIKCYGCDF